MSLINLGEIDEAMSVMRKEVAARGDDTAFALGAARVAAGAGRPAIAGEIYRGVLAKNPSDVDAMVGEGVIRAQSGDMPGAIANFRQALARRPSDVAAKNNLDLALSMTGKPATPTPMATATLETPVAVRAEPVAASVVAAPVSSGRVLSTATTQPTPLVLAETPPNSGTPPSVAAALTKLQVANAAAPDQPGKLGWSGEPVTGASAFEVGEAKRPKKAVALKRDELAAMPIAVEPLAPATAIVPVGMPGTKLGWVGAEQPPAQPKVVAAEMSTPADAPAAGKLGWAGVRPPSASGAVQMTTINKSVGPLAADDAVVAPAGKLSESQSASGRPIAVQLGAFPTERDATSYWDKLRVAHADLLNGMEPQYTQALVHGQTFWRLRVGTFAGGPEARLFCEPLRATGSACIEAF